MGRFSLFLWLFWVKNITLKTFGYGTLLALISSLFFYFVYRMPSLSSDVIEALYQVFLWSFAFSWSVSFLLFLFREFLPLFERCIEGYKLQVLECTSKEPLEAIGYGDIVKIWRRWFLLLIWLVASFFIFLYTLAYFVGFVTSFAELFSIYLLYIAVMCSGYFAFVIMIFKCKKTRLVRC